MAKQSQDLYTQRLIVKIPIASVADVLQTVAFTDAYLPESLVGFVIQDVQYHAENHLIAQLNNTLDRVKFGLSYIRAFPEGGPEADDVGVLDHHSIGRFDFAAPAADVVILEHNPIARRDFSQLKGGGLLVHPVNFYAFTYADAAIALDVELRVEVTYFRVNLTDALHKELFQSIYVRQV